MPLDPIARRLLELAAAAGGTPMHLQTPDEARAAMLAQTASLGASEPVAKIEDRTITCGDHALPIRVYTPEGKYDPPTGHLRFPGTMGVPEDVYAGVVEGVCRSLKLHGFKNIVLIGDHGSDQDGETSVAAKLNKEWAGSGVRVHAITSYYRGDQEGDAAEMMKRGIKKEEIGNHSDVRDVSLMLAVDPTAVRKDKLAAGDGKNGVEGDPRHASAEIGKVLLARTIDRTVADIKKSIAAK